MNLIEFEPILILCGNYLRSGVTAMLQGLQAGWGVASEHIRSPPSLSSLSSQSSYIHDSTSTSIFIDASVSANDIDMGLQRCPSVDNPFFFAHPSDVQEHGGQANTQGWQQKTKQSQKPESVRLLPRASACINADGSYIQISDIFEDTGTGTKAETTTTAAAGVFRKTVLFVDDPLVVLWASVGARSCAHHQKNYVSESNTVETRRGEEAGGRVVGGAEEYSHCVMQQRWDAWDRFLLTPPSVFSDSDTAVSSDWNLKTAAVAIAKLAPISVPIAVGIKIVSYQALLTLPITATAAGQKRGKRQGHELTSVASMEDVMQYLSIGTNIDKDADIITDIRDKAHCALAFIAAYRREETATGTNTDTVSSTLKQRKRTENRKGSRTGSKRFLRGHNYVPTTTSRFLLPFATSTSTSTWTTIHLPSLFLSDMLIHYAYSNPNAACAARGYLQDLISNASGDNVGIVVPPLSASVPYICTGDENRRGFGQGNVNNSSAESKAVLWDMQDQVLDQEQEQEHEKWRIQHRCHTRYAGKTYRPLSTALLQWSASHPPPILVSALTEEQEQWLGQGQAIANMRTIIEVASGLLTGSTTAISDNGSGSRFLADGYCGVRQIVIASPSSSSSSTEAGIGTGVGVRTVDVAFTLKTDISSSTPSLPLAVMHLTKTARRKCMRGSIRVFDKAIVLVADPFLSIYRAFFYSHDQHTYHSNKHVDQEKDWATFARKSASNLNITALLSVSDNGGSNSNIHGINEEIASSRNVLLVTPQALMWAGAEVGSIVKDKTKDKDKDRDQNQEKARRILQVLSFIEGERDITSGSSNSSSNSSSMDRAICASQWLPLSSTSVFSTPSDTDIDIHLEKEYQAMSTAMHAVSGLICAIHRALPANMITMLDREGWQGECDM